MRAVKLAVDADRSRGQFVLSGSTRFLTVPTLSESLAGRAALVDKASASVDEPDLRHLKHLQDRLGDRFVQGLVLYTGGRPLSFGDRLMALPISLLWGGRRPPLT